MFSLKTIDGAALLKAINENQQLCPSFNECKHGEEEQDQVMSSYLHESKNASFDEIKKAYRTMAL